MARKPTVWLFPCETVLKLWDEDTYSETTIAVNSEEWFTWLEGVNTFLFKAGRDHYQTVSGYSARAETRERGGIYWTAYKRIEGKLKKLYLGRTEELTSQRLEEVGQKFINPVTHTVVTQRPELGNNSLAEDNDDEHEGDDEHEDDEADGSDPTDLETIRGQAKTIQTLRADVELAELKQAKAEGYCKNLENQLCDSQYELQRMIDLYQSIVTQQEVEKSCVTSPELDTAIALLTESLTLRANAGGAIKVKVREALKLLGTNA